MSEVFPVTGVEQYVGPDGRLTDAGQKLLQSMRDCIIENAQSGGGGGSTVWGGITGALSAQSDLQTALDGKQAAGSFAAASHSHVKADVTDFIEGDYATAAQGALADSATQPGDLATVATTGAYSDLIGAPSGGSSVYALWKAKGNLSSASFDDVENALSWNAFAINPSSDVTLSGSQITIGTTGTYKFTVTLRTNNANRTELFIRTYIDTGSGLTQDADEIVSDYVSRDGDQDTGAVTLATALALNFGDVVEFRGFGDTDGTSIGLDAGTILLVERAA